jgi:hypothetical protein
MEMSVKRLMKSCQLYANLLLAVALAAAHPLVRDSARIISSTSGYQWNIVDDDPPYWDSIENIPPYWD